MARAAFEQRPRQPAGTGTDLDDRDGIERCRRARDPPRQIEVENEILPKSFTGTEPVARDDLAQRRQIGSMLGRTQAALAR